jgi:preprotein translocase subunit YajC
MLDFSFLAFSAPPADGSGGGGLGGLVGMLPMFAIIFGIFYFMIIRPQQKRMKEHQSLLSSVKRADKVVLNGGIHGAVHEVKETTVLVEIARNTVIEVEKAAIQSVAKADES